MTRREYEQAKLAGGSARRAGKPITACPFYALGFAGEPQRQGWKEGWHEVNDARKRK